MLPKCSFLSLRDVDNFSEFPHEKQNQNHPKYSLRYSNQQYAIVILITVNLKELFSIFMSEKLCENCNVGSPIAMLKTPGRTFPDNQEALTFKKIIFDCLNPFPRI